MQDLHPILTRWPRLTDDHGRELPVAPADLPVRPLAGGLINATYALGEAHVLQRLHPIFGAAVNLDIAALTPRLRAAGVPVPRICPARDGRPFSEIGAGETLDEGLHGVWRVLTRLPGRTLHRLSGSEQARSAGALVARFHRALAGVEHDFRFHRPAAHDTPAHMASLEAALEEHLEHRLAPDVRELRDELRDRWGRWRGPVDLPERIGHGDLKVSNLLFDERGAACGIIDLDTMARLSLDVELGDALRSWCNRAAEDSASARLDLDLFRGAVGGYLEEMGAVLRGAEKAGIAAGLLRICLELSARFAADALRERYFGWDPEVAPTRGEHNLLRARGQLDLARQVEARQGELHAVIDRVGV